MLEAQRTQNSKGDALEGAQEKLKGESLIEETTLELPRSVIKWLRCLAERENASLGSVLERRVIDMVEKTAMHRVRGFARTVPLGDHIVVFYESLGFKHEVLFTYLKSRLEKGMRALYISHKEPAADILRGMQSFGIEVERYVKNGLFELWEITPEMQRTEAPLLLTEPPSINQPIDPPYNGQFALLADYLGGKMIEKPVVVVADDPLHNLEAEIAVNYEKFHSLRLQYTPMSFVSTYSTKEVSLDGRLFLDLVKTHRHVIIQTCGTVFTL